eukprot:CAMPEP_0172370324 /NCGR_PEP_ID=MMETSP1060-20121228/37088_1 /TAXON_ID=37318 /ORGANISM="Pseudo-nitzschia pungens, Strain cf. cingulata" /LENGTH=165 /DNA_ID=CAMNT_0013095535 /DNA_START=202 /DNA_END=699 /DNA_ORIENTATION=-
MLVNCIIAGLQVLFVFISFTAEMEYCRAPLDPSSPIPMVKQTYDFGVTYNPMFHARPDWLVNATCIHAYVFWIFYSLIFYLAATDGWAGQKTPAWLRRVVVPMFLGCKVNAILFYHYMEFTSDMPPPNLVVYFGSEGGYLVSMVLVSYKLVTASSSGTTKDGKHD